MFLTTPSLDLPINGSRVLTPLKFDDHLGNPNFKVSIFCTPSDRSSKTSMLPCTVVQWSIPEEWGYAKPVLFNVYVSDDEKLEYVLLTPTPIYDNSFIDMTYTEHSKFGIVFYRVEALLDDGRSVFSTGKWVMSEPRDFIRPKIKEMTRREWWLLTRITGIETLVFRKKEYGRRCPKCYDREQETISVSNCDVCYGTGWEHGYIGPLTTYIQYEASSVENQFSPEGRMEANTTTCWTINIPSIGVEDILIKTNEFRAYKVESVGTTECRGVTVRQILTVSELNTTDVRNLLRNKQKIIPLPATY